MGDGFTLWIYDEETIQKIREDKNLTFLNKFDELSGEYLEYPKIAEAFGLKYIISNHQKHGYHLEITGNIHIYKKKKCNYGDLRTPEMLEAFYELVLKYNINPFSTKLVSFEFGVNIETEEPNTIIEQFVSYKGKAFTEERFKNDGYYKYFKTGGNKFKLYNKSVHCKVKDKSILRIELRCGTSRVLRRHNLQTLGDLLNPNSLISIKSNLINEIKKMIIWSKELNINDATVKEAKLIEHFKTPQHWVDYQKKYPKAALKKRHRIQSLISKYSYHSPNEKIVAMIEEKYNELKLTETEIEYYSMKYKIIYEQFHKNHTL
ncbi:MAG: hypothetical protein ABL929_12560 [Ferruginibacter sp.]